MKNTVVFTTFAVAVVLSLALVSSRSKVPPIPDTVFHRNVTTDSACVTCHTPGRQLPLKDTHPPKEQCLVCHKFRRDRQTGSVKGMAPLKGGLAGGK